MHFKNRLPILYRSISTSPFGYGVSWEPYSPSDDNYIIFRADNNLPASQSVVRAPAPTLTKDALSKQAVWLWNALLPSIKDVRQNDIAKPPDPTEMQLRTGFTKNVFYSIVLQDIPE